VDDSRSKASGGTGLGLSIAKNIAQAHGGTLSLRNREGGGLIAEVVLPRTGEISSADRG
jgi:signal transduction histidine kinase